MGIFSTMPVGRNSREKNITTQLNILIFNMIHLKHILLFVCCSLMLGQIQAQDKVNFCLKAGILTGGLSVKSPNLIQSKNLTRSSSNGSIAIALNAPIYKSIRIGAEVGISSFEQLNEASFDFGESSNTSYYGHYQITQAYFAVVPEFRIKKWAFINLGAGYYNDFNSNYTNGTGIRPDNSQIDLEGLSFKRATSFGFFFGAGICPNITSKLALLLEARFVGSPAKAGPEYHVDMGYRALGINLGLVYKPN